VNKIKSPERFLSLDVFRGLTVCFMIIVNSPGSGADPFGPFQHALWHGFTPTDLVFPSFLFAVGNAMSFSMEKYSQLNEGKFLWKVLKRTLLIFLLGFLLYWFPFFDSTPDGLTLKPLASTRILGVLQRIALCYFFAALMIRYLSTRMVLVVSVLFLVGYWIILLAYGDPSDPYHITRNAGSYLDMYILGEKHLYHGEGVPFEPEGILSTIPSIVNVIIGYYAGVYIRRNGKSYETISKLFLAAGALILIALAWDTMFPINKKLWTSTFVLLTTGLDLAIIAALLFLVEIRHSNEGNWTRFFTVFGKNPLFIYLLSELLLITLFLITISKDVNLHKWINDKFFQNIAPGPLGSLLFAIVFMLVCWVVGLWLDRKRIYIKV
jgi:predicted acyltransferase